MKQYSRFYAHTMVGKAGDPVYDDTYIHRLSAVNGVQVDDLTPVVVPSLAADGLAVWNNPLGRLFALVENTNADNDCDISVASTVTLPEGDGTLAVADIAITVAPAEKALIGPFSGNFNSSGRFVMLFADGGGGGTLLAGDLVVNFFKLV